MDEPQKYLAWCLDPVHIGTGGYRLGRVDMSIAREPATGIPKIPGTSLAGAVRAYAEMARQENPSLPEIDEVFGTIEGDQGKQGMLRFYDGDIILFPVNSHLGTVWVSTVERLNKWLSDTAGTGEQVSFPTAEGLSEDKVLVLKGMDSAKPIHLGWLLLETETILKSGPSIRLPAYLSFVKRLVAVSDKLFYHLVNDHLEVRTSVEIDDATGAAKRRALFTYEAIPRGTIVGFEVAVDPRRGDKTSVEQVQPLLIGAFATLKVLGIGGMGTRGFGRLEVLTGGLNIGATGSKEGGHD
jgi:CRISPR-associated protein Cmr4